MEAESDYLLIIRKQNVRNIYFDHSLPHCCLKNQQARRTNLSPDTIKFSSPIFVSKKIQQKKTTLPLHYVLT